MTDQHVALQRALLDLFGDNQTLSSFLRFSISSETWRALPSPEETSRSAYVASAVALLAEWGLLNDFFFAELERRFAGGATPQALQAVHQIISVTATDDAELAHTTMQWLQAAGQPVRAGGVQLLVGAEPVSLSGSDGPTPADVFRLEDVLHRDQRGYFAYRGGRLPAQVEVALDALRLRGHPVAPVSMAMMQASLIDGRSAALLRELRSRYFGQQNLFLDTNALHDRRVFFGREALLARISSVLSRGEHVLLTGLRKSGKSSVLNILRQQLAGHPWCRIDLQLIDPRDPGWPAYVYRELVRAVDRWGARTFADWPHEPEQPTSGTALRDALAKRRRWQQARHRDERLVLVLDEIERVLPQEGEREVARNLERAAGALRALGQTAEDRWLSIICADLRPEINRVNRMPGRRTNPFYSFFQELPLPLFSPETVHEMVTSIGRAMGVRAVSTDFSTKLHTLTGGHPALARRIAGAAHDAAADPRALTPADLRAALNQLNRADVLGRFFSENLWNPMASYPGEQELIADVARGAQLTFDDAAPSAAAALFGQGILGEREDGTLHITIGGFQTWLSRRLRRPRQVVGG